MRNLLRCCVSLSNNLLSFEHRECYCADVVWQHSFFMKTINLIVPRGWRELASVIRFNLLKLKTYSKKAIGSEIIQPISCIYRIFCFIFVPK